MGLRQLLSPVAEFLPFRSALPPSAPLRTAALGIRPVPESVTESQKFRSSGSSEIWGFRTFEAPKVLKLRLRNFRKSETPKVRNFATSETQELAQIDSRSWRIPIAPARKGALGAAPRGIQEAAPPDSGKRLSPSAPAPTRGASRDRLSKLRLLGTQNV